MLIGVTDGLTASLDSSPRLSCELMEVSVAGDFRVLELLGLGVLIGVQIGLVDSLENSLAATEVGEIVQRSSLTTSSILV